MNKKTVIYILGCVLVFVSAFMLLPWFVSLIYSEETGKYFLYTAIAGFVLGRIMTWKKPEKGGFFAKEGFVSVALSWIVLSVVGAIPLWLSGEIPNFVDALFEIVSGFTTTGASIAENVEAFSHTALFWRSFSHWIGGMGVLVFMMAILPLADGENMHILRAESPGPIVSKLVPRMRKTAGILYLIYLTMTMLEIIALLISGLPTFDAVCMSLGTAGTGGFGLVVDSAASYTALQQVIITIFMVLFGVNFSFFYLILMKKSSDAFKIEEVRWYFAIFGIASILITLDLTHNASELLHNLNLATFQVASVMTTTGYATADFNLWPTFSKNILVMLMFVGACAGSTGGGIKVSRLIIYIKSSIREVSHLIHPRSVKVVKMDDKAVSDETIRTTHMYLIVYMFIFAASLFLLSLDKHDIVTNFTAIAATLNNIGPGLEVVGPMGGYGGFSVLSKLVMIFDMLIGRLEIFPLLILFAPRVWKHR